MELMLIIGGLVYSGFTLILLLGLCVSARKQDALLNNALLNHRSTAERKLSVRKQRSTRRRRSKLRIDASSLRT